MPATSIILNTLGWGLQESSRRNYMTATYSYRVRARNAPVDALGAPRSSRASFAIAPCRLAIIPTVSLSDPGRSFGMTAHRGRDALHCAVPRRRRTHNGQPTVQLREYTPYPGMLQSHLSALRTYPSKTWSSMQRLRIATSTTQARVKAQHGTSSTVKGLSNRDISHLRSVT